MIWLILIALLFVFIMYKVIKLLYFVNVDNTLMLSGAPGTGKTTEGVRQVIKLWRYMKRKVRLHNFKQHFIYIPKRSYWQKPLIYSNLPIRIGRLKRKEYKNRYIEMLEKYSDDSNTIVISKKFSNSFDYWYTLDHYDELLKAGIDIIEVTRDKFCNVLKPKHIIERSGLPYRAIKFVTEIGKVASQHDWNNPNVKEHLNDWASMDRQYSHGGYIVMDDQSSDNVAVPIRRRIGTVLNCLHFRHFGKIYWQRIRSMTISEDIKTQETETVESNMKTHIGLFPLGKPRFDTYAFDGRYKSVPIEKDEVYTGWKTNEIMEIPFAYEVKSRDGMIYIEGDYKESLLTKKDKIN